MTTADTTDATVDDGPSPHAADPPAATTDGSDEPRWWRIAGAVRDDIRLAHAAFARATAARLRRTVRAEVELTLTGAEWVTGGEWLASADRPVALAWVELPGFATGMILRLDAAFALSALDRVLGGTGTSVSDREPSELDLSLLQEVFAAPAGAIDLVFGGDLAAAPRLALVVTRPKLLRLPAPTEPMMVLTYAVATDVEGGPEGTLCLGYPEDVVTHVLAQIDTAPLAAERPLAGDPALPRLVNDMEVGVVARLASSRFSVAALRTLRIGDVVSLDHRRDQPIEVAVGHLGLLDAALGRHGGNVAVRISGWRPTADPTQQEPTS